MKHILEVLSRLNIHVNSDHSIACIATTNPVYLVFSKLSKYPCYAVRKTTTGSAETEYASLIDIYHLAGNIIPEPIGYVCHQSNNYIVQVGSQGTPWFRIAEKYNSKFLWQALRLEIRETLNLFHEKIGQNKAFLSSINLEVELIRYYAEFRRAGYFNKQKSDIHELFTKYREQLTKLENVLIPAQHGDFTLNNLLIYPEGVTVIDFEDFNVFQVPFYDQFSISLSMMRHMPPQITSTFKKEIAFFTQDVFNKNDYSKDTMKSFFFMFLLAQLGAWSDIEKRKKHKNWLRGILLDFSNDPDKYI